MDRRRKQKKYVACPSSEIRELMEGESVVGNMVREVHLIGENRLRIRLGAVSVDPIPGGGGRALFELFTTKHAHATHLTITVEAPEFRAAAAGGIPEPNYKQITTEAGARLREDLQAMIEALDGMPDDVRRRGRPLLPGEPSVVMPREREEGRSDPGPPYWAVRNDPSDPTARGSLFVQATAPSDTVCGTCKTPIAKGDPCYEIYVAPEDKTLLGHRCTKSICIDGERIDELPPGAERVK